MNLPPCKPPFQFGLGSLFVLMAAVAFGSALWPLTIVLLIVLGAAVAGYFTGISRNR